MSVLLTCPLLGCKFSHEQSPPCQLLTPFAPRSRVPPCTRSFPVTLVPRSLPRSRGVLFSCHSDLFLSASPFLDLPASPFFRFPFAFCFLIHDCYGSFRCRFFSFSLSGWPPVGFGCPPTLAIKTQLPLFSGCEWEAFFFASDHIEVCFRFPGPCDPTPGCPSLS